MSRAEHEGLSIGYRIYYRLRLMGLSFFGPAQLGEESDPTTQLRAERAAKVAEARARKQKQQGSG
ncbi:MAG TPA: hypothetical protein VFJ94_15375 [Intrasporangium sp.]|uniref:hypothetical protein n=1 Tax=Intrasporangium sp. TaxID=1925024 RepID=UPI002D768DBF|nr:hypothetical protein [Intrasporangium sp.]HET7399897.1 hypothetical protein [Intrasporangium sp.]